MALCDWHRQTRNMNDTTPLGPANGAGDGGPGTGGAQNGAQNRSAPNSGPNQPFGAGFFAWLRGLGLVRGGDRWFAGVAGGIAAKANIDPIIVRGVFVVLAVLGGPGILLYLAGWLLLPDVTGKIHLEEVFRGRAGTAAIIVGIVVVIPLLLGIASPWNWNIWGMWGFAGMPEWLSVTFQVLMWIAVFVGISLLIARFALTHGRKVRSEQASAAGNPSASGTPPHWSEEASMWGRNFSEQASAWSNSVSEQATTWSNDVGKRADEWSARYAEHHDTRRLGTVHTVLSLAFALLAAGGAAFVAFDLMLDPTFVLLSALIAALAVLAVSLIIAGIRGRHTGWVGFLAFCGVVAIACMTLLPWGSRFQPFGIVHIGTEAPGSVLIAGSSRVDLTSLDRGDAPSDLVVWQLAGNATVEVPARAPVTVTTRVLAGNISDTSGEHPTANVAGPFLSSTVHYPGDESLPESHVTLYLVAGNVKILDDHVITQRGTGERSTVSPNSIRLEAAR